MKLFKMNDYDYVYAKSEQCAKVFYQKQTGESMRDIEDLFRGEINLDKKISIEVSKLPINEQKEQQEMVAIGDKAYVKRSFKWIIEQEKINETCILSTEA